MPVGTVLCCHTRWKPEHSDTPWCDLGCLTYLSIPLFHLWKVPSPDVEWSLLQQVKDGLSHSHSPPCLSWLHPLGLPQQRNSDNLGLDSTHPAFRDWGVLWVWPHRAQCFPCHPKVPCLVLRVLLCGNHQEAPGVPQPITHPLASSDPFSHCYFFPLIPGGCWEPPPVPSEALESAVRAGVQAGCL